MTSLVRQMLDADLERTGLTQEQFAERLGVTQQAISLWRSRDTIPRKRLSDVIDILGDQSQIAQAARSNTIQDYDRSFPSSDARGWLRTPESNPEERPVFSRSKSAAGPNQRVDRLGQRLMEMRMMEEMIKTDLPGAQVQVPLDIGKARMLFTYKSSRMVADVVALPVFGRGSDRPIANPRMIMWKMVDLALAKKHDRETARNYYLVLVVQDIPAEVAERSIERMRWEAQQFDVHLVAVASYPQAGRLIVNLELEGFEEETDPEGLNC